MNHLSRAFEGDLEVRSDGTGRTIHGIVVPFNRVTTVRDGFGPAYDEAFQMGSFAKTIRERGARVKLLSQHDTRSNPLGRATLLREDAAGLYGEFKVAETRAGDEALALVRDGALDSFSVGFSPVKQEKRNGVLWRTEVGLREASLVTFPAYADALVGGVRATDLAPEFIAALARAMRDHLDLPATTPVVESEPLDTPTGAVRADDEPPTIAVEHSARHIAKFRFMAGLTERNLR